MKDEHRLYVIILLVVVIFSDFLGVFDGLFKSKRDSQILLDTNNKYASLNGIETNEQYSSPQNIGINGNIYMN